MVDENLTLAQQTARIRRQTFEQEQENERVREELASSPPAPVEPVVPQEQPTPAPERPVDPFFQTQDTDPELVRDALAENPITRDVNRIIYGDSMIAEVMEAREAGNLEAVTQSIQPAPDMQLMMSQSGQPAKLIGAYIRFKDNPENLQKLKGAIGQERFSAIAYAVKTHFGAEEVIPEQERGLFSSVVGDVSGLVTKGDAPEALAAGGMMFLGAMSDLINQVPTIPGIIIAGDQAAGGVLPDRMIEGFERNIESAERMEEAQREFLQRGEDFLVDRLDTVTGNIVAGFAEFAFGWAGAPVKVVKGASLGAQIANSSIRGAIVDNAIYDDGDGNLTSMLVELGVVETNMFIDLLSPDMDESVFERRLAVTLEGVALGIGADALIAGVMRGVRLAGKGNIEKAAEQFDKGIKESVEQASAANKAVVDKISARAEQYYREIEPDGPELSTAIDSLEFNRIPSINAVDRNIAEAFGKFAKLEGRANDVDVQLLRDVSGVQDLQNRVITSDIRELQEVVAATVKGVFGKIQEPKTRAMVAAMSSQIIDRHGLDFLNAELKDAFQADVSRWSDEQSANLVAAATLEDMLQQQYYRVLTELSTANKHGAFNPETSAFKGAKDVDDLRLIKEKIAIQRTLLRAGRAKIANQAGRALRITQMLGNKDKEAEYTARKLAWKKEQGIIRDQDEIELALTVMDRLYKRGGTTKEVSEFIDQAGRPRGLEKWLRISNANLLLGLSTQILMIGSNVARVLSEGIFRGVQGALIESGTALRYWGDKARRDEALVRSGQQLRQSYLWYFGLARNAAKSFEAFKRYFSTGVSDFNARTFVDEDNPFSGKSLKQIFKDDKGLKLLTYSEYLYRFMGGVDEMFKELVVTTDQQIRIATGEFGQKNQKAWYKVTQEDVNRILEKNPDAVPGVDGRFSDIDSVERAREAMFQFEPVQGSVRGLVQGMLTRKNRPALLARMVGMRFVSTPLAVMEQRFTNALAPIALAVDAVNPKAAANLRVVMGKFADDLGATTKDAAGEEVADIPRRQRARAVLLTNSLIGSMAITYYLSGAEWVNLDPRSPDYMKIRSPNGGKRWLKITDAESPLNAFVMYTAMFDHLVRAGDPTDAINYMDAMSAMVTLFLDETLEKSSLGTMMESLNVLSEPQASTLEKFLVNQVTPYNPLGWYQRKIFGYIDNASGQGFDGKPVNFFERLGKSIPAFKLLAGTVTNRQRNALGELINPTNGIVPFVTPSRLDDPVINELELVQAQTGQDFLRDQFTVKGLDYTRQQWSDGQSVYDRAQQLISDGSIKIGGYTLREALTTLINSAEYKNDYTAHREDLIGNTYAPGSITQKRAGFSTLMDPRVSKLRTLFDLYRSKAVDEALKTASPDRVDSFIEQSDARRRNPDVVQSVYQSQQ